jgi:DHA1 family tetracycline resistance protein-like MFS transporter
MKKTSALPLYSTIFMDDLGYSVAMTFFAPMILDPSATMVPQDWSMTLRGVILGILMAAYPLAQFFGAPIIGALSDRYGRKNILLATLLGLTLTFVVSAVSIEFAILPLLILSRLFGGFAAGNMTIARAMLCDGVEGKEADRRITLSTVAQGLAWIVGPVVGAKLALLSSPALPFYIAAGAFAINAVIVKMFVHETFERAEAFKLDILGSCKSLVGVFSIKGIGVALAAFSAVQAAFFFFFLGLPSFFVDRFNADPTQIAHIYLLFGVAFNIAVLSVAYINKKHTNLIVMLPIMANALTCGALYFASSDILIYSLTTLSLGLSAASFGKSMSVLAEKAGAENTGKIFGFIQSSTNVCQVIAPIVSGVFIAHADLPIATAAILYIVAASLFAVTFRRTGTESAK